MPENRKGRKNPYRRKLRADPDSGENPRLRITKLRVEIKPFKREWMHESFEFELGAEEKTYAIPIAKFEKPETAKCMDEITFVIKTDAFPDDNNLRGSFEIAGLRIESAKDPE